MKFKTKNTPPNRLRGNCKATCGRLKFLLGKLKSPLWGGVGLLLSVSLSAQVTIGSATAPVSGALLDLKDGGSYGTTGATAKKGMLLPRVKLADITKLKMGDAPEIVDGTTHERAKHTGLLVYHVSGETNPLCADIADGIYIWNGEEWTALKKPDGTIERGTLALKNGIVELTDGQKIHIVSGADERGTTIPTLTLTAEWTGEGLVLTPTGKTGGQLSPFAPMISSSTPSLTSGTDVTITNTPENIALTFNDMSSLIAASPTNPWVSREWELKFKVVDGCGTTIEKTVTINQTNYALGIKEGYFAEKFVDFSTQPLKATTGQYLQVHSNTTWKATVATGAYLIAVTAGTDTGGTIADQGATPTAKNFTFTPQAVAGKKYKTATVKFEDTATPKAAKDITVTMRYCLGTEDFTSLQTETAANSARLDWETAWSDKVILHDAKVVGADRIYEEFTSADFGAAGRWMTTNLSAKAYDGIQHSQASAPANPSNNTPRTLVQHDGLTTNRYNVAFWAYPSYDRAIVANEPASAEYTANPHLGLLYTWDAATAGKGGDTGKKNIYNTSGGEAVNNESGFPEGTGTQEQRRIQGICPAGWHLPSDYEWTQLEQAIIKQTSKYSSLANINYDNPADITNGGVAQAPAGQTGDRDWRGTLHGRAMTDICENGINASKSATESGFSVLQVGYANNGITRSYRSIAHLWSASSVAAGHGWRRRVGGGEAKTDRSNDLRFNMSSVRCKKD